jgi:small multidrug resistance pump
MQYWFYLAGAIALEAAGTTSMKLSYGFTKLAPSILIFLFYDVSLAYAIWSGIGTVIIATIGILYFQEPVTALKIVSIGLIVAGVAGLKLSGVNH